MKRTLQLLVVVMLTLASPVVAQLSIPEIAYEAVDPLKLPDNLYLGEAVGVATNSKGNIFVYHRSGNPAASIGTRRTFARSSARFCSCAAVGTSRKASSSLFRNA